MGVTMQYKGHLSFTMFTLAVAALGAGCASDTSRTPGTAQATVSLSQAALLPAASLAGAESDSGPPGMIRSSAVDSLVVAVTSVEVLPESLLARRHPGEPWGGRDGGPGGMMPPPGMGGPGGRHGPGPFGQGGLRDSLRMRDSMMLRDSLGWGHLREDWYSLDVTGSGHLDLMHLPSESTSGLVLAVGTVPAGAYAGARVIVSTATVWFDTTFTVGGTTFVPGTGYIVTIPSGPETGIRTRAGFTIAEGASEVQLLFDAQEMVRGLLVTPSGAILLTPPMMGHRLRHP
jgi:hypothetical protein